MNPVSHDPPSGPAPPQGGAPLRALRSRNPLDWLTLFGPGAVIASLTIGAGELIFSSRGGAIFGFRLLWYFSLILLLKWTLVFTTARHMVLTGAHPFQRWMELPGPRGWFPMVLALMALVCFPIWVGFHAGTVGTLLSWLTGTEKSLHGNAYNVWGIGVLMFVLALVFTGGYARLERLQLGIVVVMLLSVLASLILLKPDWGELLRGLLVPQSLHYPDWIAAHREFAARPVWVETITYVGVIGGSAYDYLAYTSYLRDKGWGQSAGVPLDPSVLQATANEPNHPHRGWIRAPLIDSVMSFLAVLIFSAVFVACGAVVLGPQHQVPSGANLLDLQANFVTTVYPWLKWAYFLGAFLAIFGTLYGTIEVAPPVVREMVAALDPDFASRHASALRTGSVLWVGLGGLVVLIGSLIYAGLTHEKNPPGLVALLTPANLFTGVFGCGLVCLLNPWVDRRFLPAPLRMRWPLQTLNIVAAILFLALGMKGYWDHSRWIALGILGATVATGWTAAWVLNATRANRKRLSKD